MAILCIYFVIMEGNLSKLWHIKTYRQVKLLNFSCEHERIYKVPESIICIFWLRETCIHVSTKKDKYSYKLFHFGNKNNVFNKTMK